MDLKEFYFANIKDTEYHFCFQDDIKNVNYVNNLFEGMKETEDYSFEVFDAEEAITKFRELCQPDITHFDKEKRCWFYLITYYLYKMGYVIKEFPRILARPPIDPYDFTYNQIRDKIIVDGNDVNGTVRFVTRRKYVANLTFELKEHYIEIEDALEQKFIEISNRNATFNNMSTDEKLAELANLIENLLKKEGKFTSPNYETLCFDFITNDNVINFRKKLQCFRHSADETILERKSFTEEQKKFLIDYGLTLVKAIHSLVS